MSIKFKLTVPIVHEDWWLKSKTKLQRLVEDYQKENWASQTDPVDGSGWKPRKQPTGGWPLLNRTGRMFGTTRIKSEGVMLFVARTGVNYGGFHMSGTSKMPQRRWLGIGPRLAPEMEREISRHIFKGRRTYQ